MTRRARQDLGVHIPMGTVRIALAVAAGLVAVALLFIAGAVVHANEPVATANPAQLTAQKTAAERDVERAYEQAATQVTKVRALNLVITAAQADQIATKAYADLRALRHSAYVTLGGIMGMGAADSEAYSTATESRFDAAPLTGQTASPAPVLLAPRFYAVVSRMSEVATLIADQATSALTAPPPSANPSPSVAPSPSPRPSATPSPTR